MDGKRVVWCANIDSSKSRLEGRKIPKGQAVQSPRIEEIVEAARRLSIATEITHQKSRPRTWWEKTGYVTMPKNKSRAESLRSLTAEIRRIRSIKPDEKGRKT